jgi:hypothetical protein
MGTKFIDETQPAFTIAKCHEVFRKQFHSDRWTIDLGQFLCQ